MASAWRSFSYWSLMLEMFVLLLIEVGVMDW